MFSGIINIKESTAANMPFSESYIKNVAGSAKLYVYIPYVSNSAATLRELEHLFEIGSIPLSVYSQALTNAPLGTSGEFETTENVVLPASGSVYQAIEDTQDASLLALVSPTDTIATMATALLGSGYLITFDNKDMFVNNTLTDLSVRTITVDATQEAIDDIIEIDASSNPVQLTLLSASSKAIGIKRIDKSNNLVSIIVDGGGTIDGQDTITIDTIQANEPDLFIQIYYSTTDSEYKIIG